MRFLVWGTMPLGAFLGGVLGSTIGVRDTLLIAAIGGWRRSSPVFFSPLRTMRELPTNALRLRVRRSTHWLRVET